MKETVIQQDQQTLAQRASGISIDRQMVISRHASAGRFRDFVWGGSLF